jgi:hypothetical protein
MAGKVEWLTGAARRKDVAARARNWPGAPTI